MAYFRDKRKIEEDYSNNLQEIIYSPPEDAEPLPDEDHLQREPEPEPEPKAPVEPQPEPQAAQAQAAQPESDEARALRSQFEAQRRADEIQHQRQATADADQRRVRWLQATPQAQQHLNALGPLHHEALKAGFDDLSPEYFHYLESGLEALAQPEQEHEQPSELHLMPLDRPAPAPAAPAQPTAEFFRPVAPRMPGPSPVAVSAPVSRMIPSAADQSFESNPARIRLSPAQREAARLAGISDVEYAKGVIRMQMEIASGERQR